MLALLLGGNSLFTQKMQKPFSFTRFHPKGYTERVPMNQWILLQILSLLYGYPTEAMAQPSPPSNSSGASTIVPRNHPKLQPETDIKVSQEKKIKAKDYFIPCGQACSFQAATEAMSVLGHYFMNYKETAKEARSKEMQDNVKRCTQNLPGCDGEKLLNSSLHYNAGKIIRNAILENQTNQQDIKSLGCEDDNKNNPQCKSQVEGLDYKWFSGESTYKGVSPPAKLNIREHHERDNFQFDLNDFEANTFNDKLKELDPDMYKEYTSFFNKYMEPDKRLFSKALKQKDSLKNATSSERKLASTSKDAEQYRFESDPKGNNLLQEDLRKEVQEGHRETFAKIKEAREQALKKGIDPESKKEAITTPPRIFNNDDQFIEKRIGDLQDIIERAKEGGFKAKTALSTPKEGEEKNALRAIGISEAALQDNKLIQKEAEALLKGFQDTQEKMKGSDPLAQSRKIAEEINKTVAEQIKGEKALDDKKNISLKIDIAAFDDFLDQIWPTGAGGKLLEEFRRKSAKGREQGL